MDPQKPQQVSGVPPVPPTEGAVPVAQPQTPPPPIAPPVSTPVPPPPVPQQSTPAQPVGQGNKEVQPLGVPQEQQVRASESEPVLHPEVQEAGVEVVSEVPSLTLEDKKAGLELAKESVPAATEPTGVATLPTPQQAAAVIKRNGPSNSVAWLATLVMKLWKKKEAEQHNG